MRLRRTRLRRGSKSTDESFPQDVQELLSYFEPTEPGQQFVRFRVRDCAYRFAIGIKLVQRATGSDARIALRVRVAFRAGRHDASGCAIPEPVQAVQGVEGGRTPCGRECGRRRHCC